MRSGAGTLHHVGSLVVVAGSAVLHSVVLASEPYTLWRSDRIVWWSVFALVLVAGGYGLGLPDLPKSRRETLARAFGACLLSLVAVSMVQVAVVSPLLPRSSLVLVLLVMPLWSLLTWNIGADVEARQRQRDRVMLVVGRIEDAAALAQDLDDRPEVPAQLVAVLSVDEARPQTSGDRPLLAVSECVAPTVVVIDTAAQSEAGIVDQVAELHRNGARARTLALFYESWIGKLPVSELAQVSLLFDIGERHRLRYMRAKRIVDLSFAMVGLVALALAVPVVVVGNRWGNQGPLLFRQDRVGRDGQPFSILKFRSMSVGPAQASWTIDDDPRVTRFGAWLRRSHLDELPQVLNILRGELSIVGPRPEQVHYVEELRGKLPFYDVRHLTRPGLTGWAQVKQGYASTDADALEKLQYDIFYLRRQGLLFDLRIAWRTIRGVMGGSGR